jgi:protocatechuate 3,4-dioxygenase beta subunit
MHFKNFPVILLVIFFFSAVASCSTKMCPPIASEVSSLLWIANPKEMGDKMIISGRVLKSDGVTPYRGLILAACHPDFSKYYQQSAEDKTVEKFSNRLLNGWCKTDSLGYFEIHSMRPVINSGASKSSYLLLSIQHPKDSSVFYTSNFSYRVSSYGSNNAITPTLIGNNGAIDIWKRPDGLWAGRKDILFDK